MLSAEEVSKHNGRQSCWVIISGEVYDVTSFIDEHPGGAGVILRFAGKDATEEYEPLHPQGTIENSLSKDKHLGPVELTMQNVKNKSNPLKEASESVRMPLSVCQSIEDFEKIAEKFLPQKSWIYFRSAAESLRSLDNNKSDWRKIRLRPRVLRNVERVSTKCSIMGSPSSLPFFIAPAAVAKLGHQDGELCLARGSARMDIPYCVCTYSSVAHEEVVSCFENDSFKIGGSLFFQLYVPKVKKDMQKLIEKAKSLGFKALVITVDSAVIGKREEDDRFKAQLDYDSGIRESAPIIKRSSGDAVIPRGVHCSSLEWDDLPLIRKIWGPQPIILKGIQTVEDALKATQYDVQGIYLSNHGGRQLDYAPSAIQTLLEINKLKPEILQKIDVYLDGGVTRGTDIVKAFCLGAKGVGLGRGFMYALSAHGTEGVLKAIQILDDEVQTALRLLGVTDIKDLNSTFVNTVVLERDIWNDASLGPTSSKL